MYFQIIISIRVSLMQRGLVWSEFHLLEYQFLQWGDKKLYLVIRCFEFYIAALIPKNISTWNISYEWNMNINKIHVVLYTVLKIEFTKHSNYLLRIEQNVSTHFNTLGHWKQNTYCFTVWVILYFYKALLLLKWYKEIL